VPRAIVADDSKPPPRPVFATFTCDGEHGLLAPPTLRVELFPQGAEAVDGWSAAVKRGWSVTPGGTLCPACRGGNGHAAPAKRGRGRPRKLNGAS
jgi:hypothetical protein